MVARLPQLDPHSGNPGFVCWDFLYVLGMLMSAPDPGWLRQDGLWYENPVEDAFLFLSFFLMEDINFKKKKKRESNSWEIPNDLG